MKPTAEDIKGNSIKGNSIKGNSIKGGIKDTILEDIIYEDGDILVCRKKAGIATQTARLGEPDMESALKNYLGSPYVGVVHRLDQPVEGILVFGKTRSAAAGLSSQSRDKTMNKLYCAAALAEEEPAVGEMHTLAGYLLKNAGDNTSRIADSSEKGAKSASLTYWIEKVLPPEEGKFPVLVKVRLDTGRHHQIRVQLAAAGLPLLGDIKYGTGASVDMSRRKKIKNVALCACSLEFRHPVTGKKLEYKIEPSGEAFAPFFPFNP